MAGCIMFDESRRVGVELFTGAPEVAIGIERLCTEILTDGRGKVGYCAARCSRAERALMRWLHTHFGRLFTRQTAEISLPTDRDKLHARLNQPFAVEGFVAAHP
jgi:hypothetical protein